MLACLQQRARWWRSAVRSAVHPCSVARRSTPTPRARTQEAKAYGKLRIERTNARLAGIRAKKLKDAAKEAETAQ